MNGRRRTGVAALLVGVLLATLLSAQPALAATAAERVAGADDTGTSVVLSVREFPGGADLVYLASAAALDVVRTAGGLRGGPILLVPSCGPAPAAVVDEVARLDPDRVIALGGEAELCWALAQAVSGDRTLTRLPGPVSSATTTPAQRVFDASEALALRAFPEGAGTVYLADIDDAEATAAAGLLQDGPTLVVDGSSMNFSARFAVGQLRAERVVALGGTGAVSDEVLGAVADGRATERVGTVGSVAVAVSQRRFGLDAGQAAADTVYLTVGGGAGLRATATAVGDAAVLAAPSGCGALTGEIEAELQRLRPRTVVAVGGAAQVCDAQLERAATVASVSPRLTAQARVLSAAEREGLTSVNDTTLRFSTPPPSLSDVTVGSVLVSEPASAAPEGLLRRVTAVGRDGGALVLSTTQAAIGDVLAEGVGGATVVLGPEQAGQEPTTEALTLRSAAVAAEAGAPLPVTALTIDLDRVVHDVDGNPATTTDRVVADGTLGLALEIDTALDVRGSEVERFRFAARLQEQLDIGYTVGAGVTGDWQHEIAVIPLQPVTFFVGVVPVVVVPEIRVSIDAATGTTVEVAFSGEQTLAAVAGAEYTADGGWRDISGTSADATGNAGVPGSEADADREGGVRRTIAAELYGVAGPNVFVGTRLELRSRDGGVPRHQLALRNDAGVAVAVDLPFLGTVSEYEQVLFDLREELWRHPPVPPPDLFDAAGDVTEPRYDILEHRVDFYDTLDLAVRIAQPRPIADWSGDDALVWRVRANAGDDSRLFTVTLENSTDGPSVLVLNENTSITCRADTAGISHAFDGAWHRVSIDPSCLVVGYPPKPLTSVDVGVETYHWDAAYTKLDHDAAPNEMAADRHALDGPIRRGNAESFCEPSRPEGGDAAPSAGAQSLALAAEPSPYSPYVQEPFDVPALAEIFNDPDPQVYLRYGYHDECSDSGFGWHHILQGHPDDFVGEELSDDEENAMREVLRTGSIHRIETGQDGTSTTVSIRGYDADRTRWVIAVSNRIDSRDPLDDWIGIVTAFRG